MIGDEGIRVCVKPHLHPLSPFFHISFPIIIKFITKFTPYWGLNPYFIGSWSLTPYKVCPTNYSEHHRNSFYTFGNVERGKRLSYHIPHFQNFCHNFTFPQNLKKFCIREITELVIKKN